MGRGGETAEHERLADDLEARLVSVSDVASDSASPELLLFHEYFHGDNGRGLDAEGDPTGNGLTNMRDRMESVGGTVEIGARPEGGARVIFNGRYFDGTLGELLGRLFVKKQKELLVYVAH